MDPESGQLYGLLGLDFLLSDGIPSAVLGLGPYAELPTTRRGPITSLEMRTRSTHAQPARNRPGLPTASHLAQIPVEGRIAEERDNEW